MKAAVEQIEAQYAFSQRRACGLVTLAVSSYRYQARRSDEPLRTKLLKLAREKPRFGYRRLHVLLRRLARSLGSISNRIRGQRVRHTRGSSPGATDCMNHSGAPGGAWPQVHGTTFHQLCPGQVIVVRPQAKH